MWEGLCDALRLWWFQKFGLNMPSGRNIPRPAQICKRRRTRRELDAELDVETWRIAAKLVEVMSEIIKHGRLEA